MEHESSPDGIRWMRAVILFTACFWLIWTGCAGTRLRPVSVVPTSEEIALGIRLGIDASTLRRIEKKPVFRMREQEIGDYLGYLQNKEPDLRNRIQLLARKTLGQRYRIYLLGEFPFEIYDPDPLYSLRESDCVVFAEHMYAMALGHDWPSFFCILQRIRYKDGQIGMLTRNHYTELDWDLNNDWLVEDITDSLAGTESVRVTSIIQKARFFEKFGIGKEISPDTLHWSYLPFTRLPEVIDRLHPGDFVNIVRGNEAGKYVGHVGLITRADDGTVHFLHSTRPRVTEQPLIELVTQAESRNADRRRQNEKIARKNARIRAHNEIVRTTGSGSLKRLLPLKPYFYGFKFFRLREDPLAELIEREGSDALDIKVQMKR